MDKKYSRTDLLALERSKLANERTALAYFRTFIVLLSSGIAILKLAVLEDIRFLGWALLIVAPLLLLLGIIRHIGTRKRLRRYFP